MADDTLLKVATDELQRATDEQARVAAEVHAAQQDLRAAYAGLDAAVDALKTLSDEASAIRRQIAQTTVSADGQQLFVDLDANTSAARAKQAEIVALQEDLADAQSRLRAGQDEAAAAAARVRALTQAKKDATERDALNTGYAGAATSAPLANVPASADASSGATKNAVQAARARLDAASGGDLPDELFGRAEERWSAELARLAAVSDRSVAAEDRRAAEAAKSGLAGTTEQGRIAFERSEAALREFAQTGVARRDRALAMLAAVAGDSELNDVEKDRLKALRDAAVAANAFTLEQTRDSARSDLEAKQDAIAAARLDALAKNPAADPDGDTDVQALLGDLPGLEQALADAEQGYTDDARKALDALEAAVPDRSWSLLGDYEQALALLADLEPVVPADLVSAFHTDEDGYAAALRAEQDNARTVLAVGELARERADRVDTLAQTRSSRLLHALRGDD